MSGSVPVALPAERAFHLFTPVGERLWAPGWEPSFPAGEVGDGSAAGTVFVTAAGGMETFWTVVERSADGVRYARVAPGVSAGTVAVRVRHDGPEAAVAEVTYDLTALTDDGDAVLADLESGDAAFLDGWREAISTAVSSGRVP